MGKGKADWKSLLFLILFYCLHNEVPRGKPKQEIWVEQVFYHHDDLMVGLGENRKRMVTEFWFHCGVTTQTMSSLSFLGNIIQRQELQSEVRYSRKLDYILECCLWEYLSEFCQSQRHHPNFFFFLEERGKNWKSKNTSLKEHLFESLIRIVILIGRRTSST